MNLELFPEPGDLSVRWTVAKESAAKWLSRSPGVFYTHSLMASKDRRMGTGEMNTCGNICIRVVMPNPDKHQAS